MKITVAFAKQFEWETLQSEKLRAAILSAYSFLACLYILCISLIIKNQTGANSGLYLPATLLIFLASLGIYELITNRILHYRIKKFNKSIHSHFKYLTALVEITLISVMLYLYSVHFKQAALLSDVILVSLFYLIIFLSSFYLDWIISVVTGVIASSSYLWLSLMVREDIGVTSEMGQLLYNKYFIYATCTLLFSSGIIAAFMANQLKKSILRSVKLVEDENKLFNLFSRQISKEIATELLDNDGKMPSQLKFVSIMFIDIRDFTMYAESQTPEKLVEFQNVFFSIIVGVVEKYEGLVNQFLGDGCMVTFGAPITVNNAPANAIQAALEIKHQLDDKIKNGDLPVFNIGVGIHCGNAVTGNIGTSLKSEYSITGAVVILASRIEQFNKQLQTQILVSKDAFEYAAIPELQGTPVGEAKLKGWSHPVELYKLV